MPGFVDDPHSTLAEDPDQFIIAKSFKLQVRLGTVVRSVRQIVADGFSVRVIGVRCVAKSSIDVENFLQISLELWKSLMQCVIRNGTAAFLAQHILKIDQLENAISVFSQFGKLAQDRLANIGLADAVPPFQFGNRLSQWNFKIRGFHGHCDGVY